LSGKKAFHFRHQSDDQSTATAILQHGTMTAFLSLARQFTNMTPRTKSHLGLHHGRGKSSMMK
jgi:hypothetical protein